MIILKENWEVKKYDPDNEGHHPLNKMMSSSCRALHIRLEIKIREMQNVTLTTKDDPLIWKDLDVVIRSMIGFIAVATMMSSSCY